MNRQHHSTTYAAGVGSEVKRITLSSRRERAPRAVRRGRGFSLTMGCVMFNRGRARRRTVK